MSEINIGVNHFGVFLFMTKSRWCWNFFNYPLGCCNVFQTIMSTDVSLTVSKMQRFIGLRKNFSFWNYQTHILDQFLKSTRLVFFGILFPNFVYQLFHVRRLGFSFDATVVHFSWNQSCFHRYVSSHGYYGGWYETIVFQVRCPFDLAWAE